jgi:hypothetical protein
MNLRSPFWGLKVNKAGDAFAAEKTSNFGPRKAGLKIIFRLQEENLYVKVDPFPHFFSWLVPKRFEKFLRNLGDEANPKSMKGCSEFVVLVLCGRKVGKLLRKNMREPHFRGREGRKVTKRPRAVGVPVSFARRRSHGLAPRRPAKRARGSEYPMDGLQGAEEEAGSAHERGWQAGRQAGHRRPAGQTREVPFMPF